MSIYGNAVGGITGYGKTFILQDENGNELTGVVVGEEVVFTATNNDVREGMVYASDSGISTGTKFIPPYYASCGCKVVPANTEATITIPEYDYDNFMVIITTYNTSIAQSVVSTYTSIDNGIYAVGSNIKLSDVEVDTDNEQIKLGITVNEKSVLRYFILKEEN